MMATTSEESPLPHRSVSCSNIPSEMRTGANALLEWCRKRLRSNDVYTRAGVNVDGIQDFKESWHSGKTVLALVHSCAPDTFNFEDALKLGDDTEHLRLAFLEARLSLDVKETLTPEDVLEKPQPLSIMNYLLKLYQKSKLYRSTNIPSQTVAYNHHRRRGGQRPRSIDEEDPLPRVPGKTFKNMLEIPDSQHVSPRRRLGRFGSSAFANELQHRLEDEEELRGSVLSSTGRRGSNPSSTVTCNVCPRCSRVRAGSARRLYSPPNGPTASRTTGVFDSTDSIQPANNGSADNGALLRVPNSEEDARRLNERIVELSDKNERLEFEVNMVREEVEDMSEEVDRQKGMLKVERNLRGSLELKRDEIENAFATLHHNESLKLKVDQLEIERERKAFVQSRYIDELQRNTELEKELSQCQKMLVKSMSSSSSSNSNSASSSSSSEEEEEEDAALSPAGVASEVSELRSQLILERKRRKEAERAIIPMQERLTDATNALSLEKRRTTAASKEVENLRAGAGSRLAPADLEKDDGEDDAALQQQHYEHMKERLEAKIKHLKEDLERQTVELHDHKKASSQEKLRADRAEREKGDALKKVEHLESSLERVRKGKEEAQRDYEEQMLELQRRHRRRSVEPSPRGGGPYSPRGGDGDADPNIRRSSSNVVRSLRRTFPAASMEHPSGALERDLTVSKTS